MVVSFDVIKQYCLSRPGAYEVYPFGTEPVAFKSSNKIFALIAVKSSKIHLTLKCDHYVSETLHHQYPAVQRDFFLNEEDWNTVIIDGSVPDSEIKWMIDHSYEMVLKELKTVKDKTVDA
ncbi:MAG: MmcQ/YjbR family DNA-binding protein [Ruminiclostridium sp.]|nr:MmcQ/YjbR family DNA-binding protein [Ruminiclostridium sp.]